MKKLFVTVVLWSLAARMIVHGALLACEGFNYNGVPGSAQEIDFTFQGVTVAYNCLTRQISLNGGVNALAPFTGAVQLQILVDRDSVEIFGNNGQLYMPVPASNPAGTAVVSISCADGTATLNSPVVSKLESAWAQ